MMKKHHRNPRSVPRELPPLSLADDEVQTAGDTKPTLEKDEIVKLKPTFSRELPPLLALADDDVQTAGDAKSTLEKNNIVKLKHKKLSPIITSTVEKANDKKLAKTKRKHLPPLIAKKSASILNSGKNEIMNLFKIPRKLEMPSTPEIESQMIGVGKISDPVEDGTERNESGPFSCTPPTTPRVTPPGSPRDTPPDSPNGYSLFFSVKHFPSNQPTPMSSPVITRDRKNSPEKRRIRRKNRLPKLSE